MQVSVIIPAYNAAKTIKECLNAVFAQSFKNFEIVVVNDCSKDKTVEIVKEFNVRIVNLKKNSGASISRNEGAKAAKSNTLVFLDSDCIVNKGWLKTLLDSFEKDLVASVSQYSKSMSNEFIAKFCFHELGYRDKNLGELDSASSCNFICRKKDFFKIKGFTKDRYTEPAEDMDFFFRLSKLGKIKFIDKARVGHYFRDNISGYLKQQKEYSRSSAYIFLKDYNKNIFKQDTLQDKQTYIEIMLTLILPLLLFSVEIFFIGILIYILTILILNIPFLSYLERKENMKFMLRSIPIIFIRDFYWAFGVIQGIFGFMRRKLFK